ncbi:MAG: DNA gyrase subunit A [PVC group bacterium]|nr:DNA gyrase subunit A [PVC group bacterium]
MYAENEKIVTVPIEEEMKKSYIDYAMSVIVGRALPDIRDGLKPVHRRILYAMKDLSLEHNKPYKKCARIVGEVLGKYHPHGDTAVYDSLVRMVQTFSLRYPFIDGQGNFGSVDGDRAAAMRYTEARMASITKEMLVDIEKDTVDFSPNFDESLQEPKILPAALPGLLINGSSGIAVGMATNIPPHNLTETIDAIMYLIDNPEAKLKELMKFIKGPDFPTGGIICGREGIKTAYETGRSPIKVRAKATIEEHKNGRESIIINEIPYQVNKTNVIEAIASLVNIKKIEGISDIRDESDKDGMRVVIDLKRDGNAQVVLNLLYKHTQLETTFGIILLALVDTRPRVLTLKQMLHHYIEHRQEIIVRRTKFELRKAQERAHILEGLKICLDNLDKIIKLIRSSKTTAEAKINLMEKFGLSEVQSQAILEMQLQRLTALEREKIENEYLELLKKINMLKAILADPKKVLAIIKEELELLKKKYGDERRTQILAQVEDFEIEDLIAQEDVVITISHGGYIKRQLVSAYRQQRRGGKGVSGSGMKEEDFIEHLFIASTHDYLLVFTDKGKVYWVKVYEIPQASRLSKGKAIVNLLQFESGEKISALIQVKEFEEGKFLTMATKNGQVKKTDLMAYSHPRKGGISAITLRDKDALIACKLTDGQQEIILATKGGKAIRFAESDVRHMGRTASGVRGISLSKKDYVVGMEIVEHEGTILTVTESGVGKRTKFEEYRVQSRGGKGIINIKTTKTNGEVVAFKTVVDTDELMLITSSAMVVRCPIKDIRSTGRSTQGVRLIRTKEKDKLVAVARLAAKDEETEE